MSHAPDIDHYVKDPSLLVALCREVIERLDAKAQNGEKAAMEAQLREIAKAINNLAEKNIPVPDSLRAEKIRLVAVLGIQEEAMKNLEYLAHGIDELFMAHNERLGIAGSVDQQKNTTSKKRRKNKRAKSKLKVPRAERSKLPRTEADVLRQLIIEVLNGHGGRATLAEVIEGLRARLNEKFLPGDLELRLDGKTVAWENNACWERYRMTQEGVLKTDSLRGIWELSEERQ